MTATWSTALVTGASAGIGEAMARQLAERGVDLVVVARREAQLRALADALPVHVEVLAADLADEDGLAAVEARLAERARPVDLVVNNAGFGANGDFLEVDLDISRRMLAVNVTAVMRLTHAALQAMVERGHGSVVNVSSMASLQPSPGLSLYAATKAFVTTFSESLHGELDGTGVTVTAVLPGFTRTEFQERAGYGDDADHGLPAFVWQDAASVAAEALAAAERGRATVVTGRINKVAAAVTAPIPRSVRRRVVKEVSRRFGP
jgi:uncharacterized protein